MKMLPHRTRLCVLMLIILTFCQESAFFKAIITPKGQIIINEGERLEIKCESIEPVKFADPKVLGQSTKTSNADTLTNKYDSVYVSTLQKSKTIFGDTGWYGCATHDVDIATNFYNHEVSWLYVYVKSNTNLFVEENNNIHLNVSAGTSIIIPCRTTSPDQNPILINGNEDILNEASFDPKIGFTITNLSIKDNDSYKCLIRKDNKEYIVNYVLSVNTKHFSEPIMQGELLTTLEGHHVFYMNCSVEIDMSIRYVFSWNTPQSVYKSSNSERKIQEFRKYLDGNIVLATSVLTLFDVTKEDSGLYKCFIRSTYGIKKVTKIVTFEHEKGFPEFKHYFHVLANQFSVVSNYYRKESGSNVEWTVIAKAPSWDNYYQWFKPNGEIIKNSPKYSIKFEPHYSKNLFFITLKINSLNVMDSGNYTLEAKNQQEGESKKINITLHVTDKPIPILMLKDSYYPPNESTEFRCQVISNLRPNITWSFLKYPNYPLLPENLTSENLTLKNVTQIEDYSTSYKFESIVKIPIEVPGKLTCKACNDIGCNSMAENIIVSDGFGAFGIIGPKEFVLKGDNIELVCAASIYNYTDEFKWTKLINQTEEPVVETERLKIERHNTQFTYRSTLKLSNVQESDANDYFCVGNIKNTSNDEALYPLSDRGNYKLVIYNPMPPFLTETNMNKSKTRTIDFIAEGRNTLKLQCYADGMPKPTVTWYKDNMLLTNNNLSDQYLLLHKGQELHIKYWMQYDSGNYSCRATSRIGINETYQLITVEKNTKWNTLNIVLVTLIPILGFILIILATFFTVKIRQEQKVKKELMEAGLVQFEEGAVEWLNPNLTVKDQAELLPYNKKWEFPKQRLIIKEQLGSGQFGMVMKAEAIGIRKNENVTSVAVKMIRPTTNPFDIHALTSELKIMVHLGKHLNIVNLLGACTRNIFKCKLMLIIEYCCFGNLKDYLLKHRDDFINQINPETGKYDFIINKDMPKRTVSVNDDNSNLNSDIDAMVQDCPGSNPDYPKINSLPDCVLSNNVSRSEQRSNYASNLEKHQNPAPIRSQDLLSWAFQVARGMEYLSQRKILHGDLAARNILLAEDNIVKISDFGLSKNIYKYSIYKKKGYNKNTWMPIKWMAIESIRDGIFSTQSDVWSFGIMLWEFFTLAETPYAGMQGKKQYEKLVEGYRLEQPNYAVYKIYDIMLQCWVSKPTLRPSFTDLVEDIGRLMQESVRQYYITLSHEYMEINMMEENLKNEKDYLMMMSAPDHRILSLPIYKCMDSLSEDTNSPYLDSDCSTDESKILRPLQNGKSNFCLPSEDVTDLPPTPKHEDLSEAD